MRDHTIKNRLIFIGFALLLTMAGLFYVPQKEGYSGFLVQAATALSDEEEENLRQMQEEVDAVIAQILAWKKAQLGVASNKELFSALAPGAGTSPTDWYALALLLDDAFYGETEPFFQQLLETMKAPEKTDVEQYRRLLVWAEGCEVPVMFPEGAVHPDTLMDKGILSLIYELKYCDAYGVTVSQDTIESLCELELPEGGFALMGAVGDVDVTALALQALFPYQEYEVVGACVERTLMWLSQAQGADGGFSSYGISNAESVAQVILALCQGEKSLLQEAFVKKGNTAWDALQGFCLETGGVSHTKGGVANEMATAQTLYTCVVLRQTIKNFLPESSEPASSSDESELSGEIFAAESIKNESEATGFEAESTQKKDAGVSDSGWTNLSGKQIKGILLGVVGVLVLILLLAVFLTPLPGGGRKHSCRERIQYHGIRMLGILATGSVLCLLLALFLQVESVSEYSLRNTLPEVSEGGDMVYLSITAEGEVGVILEKEPMALQAGDTVFTLLKRVTDGKGISLTYQGGTFGASVYVEGIAGLHEFDGGPQSGWIFRVNGEVLSKACSDVYLSPGDTVEWIYTKNLGEDVP